MSDQTPNIVEWLRHEERSWDDNFGTGGGEVYQRAADEIERLRAIVTDLAALKPMSEWCVICGREDALPPELRHSPVCLVARARQAVKPSEETP